MAKIEPACLAVSESRILDQNTCCYWNGGADKLTDVSECVDKFDEGMSRTISKSIPLHLLFTRLQPAMQGLLRIDEGLH